MTPKTRLKAAVAAAALATMIGAGLAGCSSSAQDACGDSDGISVSLAASSTADTEVVLATLTNHATKRCTVDAHPAVEFRGEHFSIVPVSTDVGGNKQVTLAPSAKALLTLLLPKVDKSSCTLRQVTSVAFTPAKSSKPSVRRLPHPLSLCGAKGKQPLKSVALTMIDAGSTKR